MVLATQTLYERSQDSGATKAKTCFNYKRNTFMICALQENLLVFNFQSSIIRFAIFAVINHVNDVKEKVDKLFYFFCFSGQ